MPKTTKRRVRLKESLKEQRVKALAEGRDRSRREARKKHNGKLPQGYKYKEVLQGYRENGLEPTIIKAPATQEPMFVVQPTLERKIIKMLKRGAPYTTVCRACGITPTTFMNWLEKGKAGFSEDYIRFYRRVCKAEAAAEMQALKDLKAHKKSDWRVSAWELERRWPENWSKVSRTEANVKMSGNVTVDTKEKLGNTVVQDEATRELARKLIDGSEFGFSRLETVDADS